MKAAWKAAASKIGRKTPPDAKKASRLGDAIASELKGEDLWSGILHAEARKQEAQQLTLYVISMIGFIGCPTQPLNCLMTPAFSATNTLFWSSHVTYIGAYSRKGRSAICNGRRNEVT